MVEFLVMQLYFHKPCLMGTEVGTKIFKTCDIIEIDFSKNIAYKV